MGIVARLLIVCMALFHVLLKKREFVSHVFMDKKSVHGATLYYLRFYMHKSVKRR